MVVVEVVGPAIHDRGTERTVDGSRHRETPRRDAARLIRHDRFSVTPNWIRSGEHLSLPRESIEDAFLVTLKVARWLRRITVLRAGE